MIRAGLVTRDGRGEIVTGLVMMLIGENSRRVVEHVKEEIAKLQKSLPPGVSIEPLYDRTHLIDQTLDTVIHNLLEGGILVIVILLALLGNVRGGLIVALAIPLSMLFAANIMLASGVTASLMSLGAIDFGLIVDSSVIMIENCVRRLAHEGGTRPKLEIVRDAAVEVRKPTMFGELIIMIVYLPILTLEGIEGKLFRPMALTVVFALAASMLLSLTLMPVLASLGLPRKVRDRETIVDRAAQFLFRPLLHLGMRFPWATLILVGSITVATTILGLSLGSEFVPRLGEGTIVINTIRLASISLEESLEYGTRIEALLKEEFPDEVDRIWSRTGTAEVATDPMGFEVTDVYVTLKPRNRWRKATTQDELVEAMSKVTETLPGMRAVYSQPIELRINEMLAGIRADLGIKLFGDDIEVLKTKAAEIERVVKQIRGAADVSTEQITGLPVLRIVVDRQALS
ncbi:efflux RND transporter permease subunit, partial [Singulisphaera rosea]